MKTVAFLAAALGHIVLPLSKTKTGKARTIVGVALIMAGGVLFGGSMPELAVLLQDVP